MLSIIGSLVGFGTSFMPKVMAYFQDKQDKAHELALMDKQLEQQRLIGAQKLQMINAEADIREIEALHREHQVVTGKASVWMINLAASVRPMLTYLFFVEFAALTVAVFFGWIDRDQYGMVWNQEMQAIWSAVVAFWFGSRSFNRKSHT